MAAIDDIDAEFAALEAEAGEEEIGVQVADTAPVVSTAGDASDASDAADDAEVGVGVVEEGVAGGGGGREKERGCARV